MTWEILVQLIPNTYAETPNTYAETPSPARLNKLGAEGWEPISVLPFQGSWLGIFKRPREEPDEHSHVLLSDKAD